MEDFVKNQIVYGLKYVPGNLVKSAFRPKSSSETRTLRERGFICGVCHPSENYEQIKQANIGWVRVDIPFPFNKNGALSESYLRFKARAGAYVEKGLQIMAVTPYHYKYTEHGIELQSPQGKQQVREIAVFLLQDLRGLVHGYQITNEMGIPRFTVPLTMRQAAEFIGIQLESMYPHRGETIIGYNSAGPQADLHYMLKPYHKYCDYVGVDWYMGCFFSAPGLMCLFDALIAYLWSFTGKPIILQEFGYIGDGAPKSKQEKLDILRGYGAASEKDAINNITAFVAKLPEYMQDHIKRVCGNDLKRRVEFIFKGDYKNHLYCELPKTTKIPGYPHTPEGQAKFFREIIPKLYKKPYLAGMIVYCYSDSDKCYVCGQSNCPTETRWGLVDQAGKPKPSYYAVRDAFGAITAE